MLRSTVQTPDRQPGTPAGALRSIGDVALELGVEPHVLRFWERKFAQIQPVKRGNGRRYYRPENIELLRRIRTLLYTNGYTIKGLQRLLDSESGKPAPRAGIKVLSGTRLLDIEPTHSPLPQDAPVGAGHREIAGTLEELREALAQLRQTLLAS